MKPTPRPTAENRVPLEGPGSALGPFVDPQADGAYPPEALPDICTVAILGASLAGCALAWYLAREGVDVVVLDDRPGPGLGASGRFLGHVDLGVVEHPHRTIAALGAERAAQLFAWSQRNRELLVQAELFDPCGNLWAAVDGREPDDIRASAEALTALGIEAHVLDADEADQRTGAYNLGPALWLPGGGRIEPWRAVATLVQRAEAHDALFIGNSPARLLDDDVDGVCIETPAGRMIAETAVIAAGAGAGATCSTLAGRITPVREQALLTEPVFGYFPGAPRAGHGYIGWRQLPDGHLAITGARWATAHLEVGEGDDGVVVPQIQRKLEAFLRMHFRQAELTPVIDRWAWTFGQTPDGLPIIGPLPGDPRRIACTGFGGSPATLSMAAARAVADGLLEGGGEVPWFLSPRRMVRWRAG